MINIDHSSIASLAENMCIKTLLVITVFVGCIGMSQKVVNQRNFW
jgi:hypothetical protein